MTASADENADLYWGLIGGGNNFCVVTSAVLSTLPVSSALLPSTGTLTWGTEVRDQYLDSVVQFANNGHNFPKASFEGQTRWAPSRSANISFDGYLWYSGEGDTPLGLENFTAPVMPIKTGELVRSTIGNWSNTFNYAPSYGTRASFHWRTSPATLEAAHIVFDTYYAGIASLADVANFSTALSFLPATTTVTAGPAGNAMNLTAASGPALWYVQSPLWGSIEDDERVLSVHDEVNVAIVENLAAAGLADGGFLYLSDIAKSQIPDTYASYGETNLARLKAVRDAYDPDRVFTDLVPGGAKIATS